MTSIQILELDGSAELLVVVLPVDLEAKLCAGLENEGNLVVGHVCGESGDVQNGFMEIWMGLGVVSGGHVEVGHHGCCREEREERAEESEGRRATRRSLSRTPHLLGRVTGLGRASHKKIALIG